jgi:cyanophycinase
VPGPVALVGAGEFLAPMAEFDRGLLEATGRSRPRVAVIPTASAVDGEETFLAWAEMGVQHFSALGAEVEPVLVRTAADGHDGAALQAIGEADLIYLSGGHPRHLLDVLRRSPLGAAVAQANARGAVVAGCSAGAMALVGRTMDFRQIPRLKVPLPFPIRWPEGLSLVNGVAVLPHYDAWPEPLTALVALQAPRSAVIVGIDEDTAVVGRSGAWQVHGRGRVTVWRGRHRERFRKGEAFRI